MENMEEDYIITLTDQDGNDVDFEFLDVIDYKLKKYIVLLPTDEEADEVVILEVKNFDTDNEEYIGIDDQKTIEAVFALFKQRINEEFDFID